MEPWTAYLSTNCGKEVGDGQSIIRTNQSLATSRPQPYRRSLAACGTSWKRLLTMLRRIAIGLRILPDVPFYRDFNRPIFEPLGIAPTDYAWLPLIKLPLPAGTRVSEDDIWVDRFLLWKQITLLKPPVMVAQGMETYKWVSAMCEDKFPHHIILQRIGLFSGTSTRIIHPKMSV